MARSKPAADQRKRPIVGMPLKKLSGGGGGIRTHGTVARTAVFKTAALNHSATPPVLLAPVPGSWFLVPGSWFLVPGRSSIPPGGWLPGSSRESRPVAAYCPATPGGVGRAAALLRLSASSPRRKSPEQSPALPGDMTWPRVQPTGGTLGKSEKNRNPNPASAGWHGSEPAPQLGNPNHLTRPSRLRQCRSTPPEWKSQTPGPGWQPGAVEPSTL